MDKKYQVTIEYLYINRENHMIVWAENSEEAKKIALRWWGNPSSYKSLVAEEL